MDIKREPVYTPTFTPTTTLTLRPRRHDPDVPRDVEDDIREHLLHLNDPNWDFNGSETSTLSGDTVALEHRHRYPDDVHIGPSIGTAPSDIDTESRADSMYGKSEARLKSRSEIYDDHEE